MKLLSFDPGSLRVALRGLWKPTSRVTTLTIVLTLGMAIGSMVSLFSIVEAVVLQSLPYRDPDQLVRVQLTTEDRRDRTIDPFVATPIDLYEAWRHGAASFDHLGAVMVGAAILPGEGSSNATRVPTVAITSSIFAVLGARPLMGRVFLAEEDAPGTPRVTILTHRFWIAHFNGDSSAIGRTVSLDGEPYRVVAVMPRGFRVPLSVASVDERKAEVLIPIGTVRRLRRNPARPEMVGVIGRLRPGVSFRAAMNDVDRITGGHLDVVRAVQRFVLRTDGDRDLPRVSQIVPLHDFIIRDARGMLLLLLGGVAAVLVMSCANAANLLLARTIDRRREFAVQRALGSSVSRLAGRLVVEAVILALAAAAFGTILAGLAIPTLVRLSGSFLPFVQDARLNFGMLGVVILLVLGMGVTIGLVPAFLIARDSSFDALRDGTTGSGRGRMRQRLSDTLVVGQIGLAVVLLTVMALLAKSLFTLTNSYRGYDVGNRVAVQFPMPEARYATPAAQVEFVGRIIREVSALPFVSAVAAATGAPALGGSSTIVSRAEGAGSATPIRAQTWAVTPNYFTVLGMTLRAGRGLRGDDDSSAVVLDLAAADALFGRPDPVGMTVTWEKGARRGLVVGIVGNVEEIYPDAKTRGKQRTTPLHFYTALGTDVSYDMTLIARTTGDPAVTTSHIRQAVAAMDTGIPIELAGSLEDLIGERFARERLLVLLIMIFSALAVAIAAVGTYAVVAHATARRTAELGVRIALGASAAGIVALAMRRILALAAVGATLGVAGSAVATRSLTHWLFEVSPLDPGTFAVGVTLILLVSLVSGALPALRATRIDPTAAFRRD